MQGEGNIMDERSCWLDVSPNVSPTRSADCTLRGCPSPIHISVASKSAPPSLGGRGRGARCSDGQTRRYVRSSEPRLKWNAELHQCFVRAIQELGGPEKATPKSILQTMNVRGLRIAHVKSHLQMFRNPKKRNSGSPQSGNFIFCSANQSAHPDPVQENPGSFWSDLTLDHEPEAEGPDSWTPIARGAAFHHMNMTNVIENSSGKEQRHSGELSGCTSDSSLQFNPINQFGSGYRSAGNQMRAANLTPEIFKESYPSIYKMVEVLESRASKPRDLETLDDVGIDRRQILSNQLLAGDVEATQLYDSAELLAHNLLMAMRERRLLETNSTTKEHCELQLGQQSQGTMSERELLLDLTMSVGVRSDPDSDISPEILTLDLTGQMNRSSES